ncbi:N-6 DNA methylase [Robiginitalea biformata]|uniref:site-specific DNA-methyltransferase (adenine-specific) n=1 Tax=Robiginitalea biformata (strain ATCC BAA-864 / DSM 15991 / KCTC 12146 / HTCC2501) TaxID=313596 RepID=A4CI94_ROBBH|nr:N-6 DNA methylase [Robiginitalea biformata]EAR16652.1 type I restriction-modification system, M subunit [Robiginitalea biformata HTCC2501]
MSKSENLENLALKALKAFRVVSTKPDDAFLLLYVLGCFRHYVKLQFTSEKSSYTSGLALFPNRNDQGELSFTQTRLLLLPNYELPDFLRDTYRIFERRIENFQLSESKELLKKLEDLYLNLPPALYAKAFETLLEKIVKGVERKRGEIMLPSEIAKFLINISNLHGGKRVFNPFAGLGSFGIFLNDSTINYHGQEIDDLTWAVTTLRLDAHDKLNNSSFEKVDSFLSWPNTNRYDLIISNPPFGLRLGKHQQTTEKKYKTVEQFLLTQGIELLTDCGKMIAIVPNGLLYSKSNKGVRQRLIEEDLVEAVISFPGGLFLQSNSPFSVIVISKTKERPGSVLFFPGENYAQPLNNGHYQLMLEDITKDFLRRSVSIQTSDHSRTDEPPFNQLEIDKDSIKSQDYSLDHERYRFEEIEGIELQEIVEVEKGYQSGLIYVSSIFNRNDSFLEKFFRKMGFSQLGEPFDKEGVAKNDYGKIVNQNRSKIQEVLRQVKFISTKDLKNDPYNYSLEIDSVQFRERSHNARIIVDEVVLVTLIGSSLKPTFVSNSEPPFYLHHQLIALKPNPNLVDLDWFINHLHSDSIKRQLALLKKGSGISYLRRQDLLSLKFALPSLKEQKSEMVQATKLYRQIDSLESDIIQQNAYLRHTLAGPVSDLFNAVQNIDEIIREIALEQLPELLQRKLSAKHIFTLENYLEQSKTKAKIIRDTVQRKLSVAQTLEGKKMTNIDLFRFVENYVHVKKDAKPDYEVLFDYDKEGFTDVQGNRYRPKILGNKELLTAMLDNLIDNAVAHAFQNKGNDRIEIFLSTFLEDPTIQTIEILVSNTGNPIDSSLTFDDIKQNGFSFGSGQGQGFGGWFIDQVIRKHKGEWDLIDESGPERLANSDLATSFELKFPISD